VKNDVSVIGAGPAGAWAAYSLARRGARVTLVDPSHPREKPCGGGVTGRALSLVAGALDIAALPACVIRTARFTQASSGDEAVVGLADAGLSTDTGLVVASRTDFDGLLLAAACGAGATVLAARATDIVVQRDGVRIHTTGGLHSAARILGADGANSLVRRRLARPFRRSQLSIATGYFAHGVTSDEIVVELADDPAGYLWSFPRPTHLAIGVCAQADAGITAEALRARVLAWIRDKGLAPGARLEPYSWPIPSLAPRDFEALDISGPRWVLAGDAAGLVDPITREGIFFALLSGEWAADALASDAADPWRHYRERVQDEIGSELARAARLKAGFFRPRFTHLMIDALRQSTAVRGVMADLVAGRQSYAQLKWRLARTLEVGLAWRLVTTARRRA
jgi:geranylgeranyl reductase family protein